MSASILRTHAQAGHHAHDAHLPSVEIQARRTAHAQSSFAAMLERAVRAIETPVVRAVGTPVSPSPMTEALELQARVYRDAERVELASKLLDHAVGAVKTVLQTRV